MLFGLIWFAALSLLALIGWRKALNGKREWLDAHAGLAGRFNTLKAEATAYAQRIDQLVNNVTGLQALLGEGQATILELRSKLAIASARLDEELAIKAATGQQMDAIKSSLRFYQDAHKKGEQRLVEADRDYAEAKARWQDREGMMKAQKDAADAELGKMLGMLATYRRRVREADQSLQRELDGYQFETREVRPPLEQPSLVAALAQAAEVSPTAKE